MENVSRCRLRRGDVGPKSVAAMGSSTETNYPSMLGLGISSEKLNPCLVFGKTRDKLVVVDDIRLSAANDCAIRDNPFG